MKRLILIFSICLLALPAMGQTLLGSTERHGFFGAPVVRFSEIDSEFALFVGGRGGWMIFFHPDNAIVLGGGGYGLTTNVKAGDHFHRDRQQYLAMGYGGFEVEYIHRSDQLTHFSIQMLIGGGEVAYRDKGDDFDTRDGDTVFVFEPGLSAEINLTNFMRLGLGGSYRLVDGFDGPGIGDRDLSGFSGTLTFKFGSF